MIRSVIAVFALSALSNVAMAQPKDGDLVVSDLFVGQNVLYLNRGTGQLFSISTGPAQAGGRPNAVLMAADNHDLIATELNSNLIYSVTPTGVITTLANAGTSTQAGDLLQDGDYVFTSFATLFRMDSAGNLTTLTTFPPTTANGMARDHDTDTILIPGTSVANALLEWDPRTNSITTLCAFSGTMSGADPLPRGSGGNRAIALSNFVSVLAICSGNTINSIAGGATQCLKVDDATGNVYTGTSRGDITETDPATGTTVNSWGPFAGSNFSGIESYRSRKVAGSGTGAPGSPYSITLNFGPGAANGSLFVALSFSQRPGIQTPGGGRINLGVDPILIASVQGLLNGAVLRGFPATLDGQGRAGGTILIPSGLPRGTRFFTSAIAIVQQSIVITANTIGVHVQ